MANQLEKISTWGWKKGTEKQLKLLQEATRDTPFQHKMFKSNGLFVLLMILMILGLTGVALVFAGPLFHELIQPTSLRGAEVTSIHLAIYGFYLFFLIPAILLGTAFMQFILLIFPSLGNTYTGMDMVKAMAVRDGNRELWKQASEYKVPRKIVLEKTRFIDLTFIRKKGLIGIGKAFLLTTLVFLPFMFLSVNTHFSKLEDNTLIYSSFFQVDTETITIENIDMVSVYLDWDQDHLEPYYEIELNDNRVIDLWEIGIAADDINELTEIAMYLKAQGVFHYVHNLPDLSSYNDWTKSDVQTLYQALQ